MKLIGLIVVIIAISITVWINLPVSVSRYSDINLGNTIIERIESYQKVHGLPESNDWVTLKTLGFRDNRDFVQPAYQKLNNNQYQLAFVEGFDGPYLLWNSINKKWRIDQPLNPYNSQSGQAVPQPVDTSR
jgi:hypothetical protein